MKQILFNPEDVKKVAKALGNGLYEVERGRNAHLCCEHCKAYENWDFPHELFVHEPDCVILVVRDLLTGLED